MDYSKTVSVVGLGYIGLPTAALIASKGIAVAGVDVNPKTVECLNQGEVTIVEPCLEDLVIEGVRAGKLSASLTPSPAEVFMIAVPTPFSDGFKPDLGYVKQACYNIAPVLKSGDLVILESTSPVGTTELMSKWLSDARPDLCVAGDHVEEEEIDICLAYCPERVLPGKILSELVSNDRIVGGITGKCAEKAVALYKTFVEGDCVVTSSKTAEMAKLTENSFRDVNIAFANELSIICNKLGIDVWELIELSNLHPRVNILQPGCGVGGHCIAVDPWFIVDSAPEDARLIRTAREINDGKPHWVAKQVDQLVQSYLLVNPQMNIQDVKIACYGLAFKPNIDDLRESPAMVVSELLAEKYSQNVVVVEPNIESLPPKSKLHELNIDLVDMDDAEQCHIKVILVPHTEFSDLKGDSGRWVYSPSKK